MSSQARGRPPIEEITDPQRRTLRELRRFTNRRGFPPTIDELAEAERDCPLLDLPTAALVARDFVRELVGEEITLVDVERGKYAGRVVARVRLADGRDLTGVLIEADHGRPLLRRGERALVLGLRHLDESRLPLALTSSPSLHTSSEWSELRRLSSQAT